MKASLYIETTIPSYVTARPSTNLIAAARQALTRKWWDERREHFELFVCEAVWVEASAGDPDAAANRIALLETLPRLEIDDVVLDLAERVVGSTSLPAKAVLDATHIAVAARHGMDYLLTWNCTHIANAEILPEVNFVVAAAGFLLPTICTPDELMGEAEDEENESRSNS